MRHPRYICIHGHFYQPPRENPWLGVVEVQDSAAPFHDWNERITHECYAPNTRARLLDGQGRIINLLNNYAWISFNFGPTLLQWMADAAPEALPGIVEADRLSQERRRGHGNALAQVYNHMILPLASPRDKQTQVLWGIADFRHRFGRDPEGMWLAETAVDMRVAGSPGRGRHSLHDPGAPASSAVAQDRREELDRDLRRHRSLAGLPLPPSLGTLDRPVLLRRHRLSAGRLRAAARSRRPLPGAALPGVRRPPRTSPAHAHRH